MKIIVSQSEGMDILTSYLDFNQIDYTLDDLWDNDTNTYNLPPILTQDDSALLIVSNNVFRELCTWDSSRSGLVKFCNNRNKLWVWNDIDNLPNMIIDFAIISNLDLCVPPGSVNLFPDGSLTINHPANNLNNIYIHELPTNFCLGLALGSAVRIYKAKVDKHDCSKDYMLTTSKKRSRFHRNVLWKQLSDIPGLLDRGHVSYTTKSQVYNTPSWAGHQLPHGIQGTSDFHPSMDLYTDSWLEIVPETLYHSGYFITEKTIKPMVTKTPFLLVTTRYQLEYMKQLGFQTFSSIINESYDNEPRIEDRVKLMLVQLQDIIKNGTQAFYNECTSILEHNQNKVFEYKGRYLYTMDLFLTQHFELAEKELG